MLGLTTVVNLLKDAATDLIGIANSILSTAQNLVTTSKTLLPGKFKNIFKTCF